MAFRITAGSTDDRKALAALTAAPRGKVFADQGYNRKNDLLPLLDKVLLRKGCIIETLFEVLKSSMGLAPTRPRWPVHALVHLLSCLAATTLAQSKVNIGIFAIPNSIPNSIPTSPNTH